MSDAEAAAPGESVPDAGAVSSSRGVVIFDGVHTGYGYERLYLQTPLGTLKVGADGDVEIWDRTDRENAPALTQDDAAAAALKQMVTDGMDDNGRALQLYEEDMTVEFLDAVTAILSWGGLPPPYLLNHDDGTLTKRWSPLPKEPRKRFHGDADDFDADKWLRAHAAPPPL